MAAQTGARAALEGAGWLAERGRDLTESDLSAVARRVSEGVGAEGGTVDLTLYDRALIDGRR